MNTDNSRRTSPIFLTKWWLPKKIIYCQNICISKWVIKAKLLSKILSL